jgi:hypothetical protein
MAKRTSDELSAGKKPVSQHALRKNPFSDAKNTPVKPDSKPWIHNRVPDHDKSQREPGRH